MARDSRTYLPYARDAATLLGSRIQLARRERRWTEQELADRAGISRPTLRRIEQGDLGVGIGLVFEVAALLGITLFHDDARRLGADIEFTRARLALLPRQVKPRRRDVIDDF